MSQDDLDGRKEQIGSVASITIPDGTEFRKDKPMPDFSVYYVVRGAGTLLGIYVGNAPSYQANTPNESIKMAGCPATSVRSFANGVHGRDILISLGRGYDFPHWLHLFYRNLDADAALLADRIAESLMLLDGYGCAAADAPGSSSR